MLFLSAVLIFVNEISGKNEIRFKAFHVRK